MPERKSPPSTEDDIALGAIAGTGVTEEIVMQEAGELAQSVHITLGEGAEMQISEERSMEIKHPLLSKFQERYQNMLYPKPSWEVIKAALTPDVLAKAAQLDQARLCWVEGDELVLSDGGPEVPEETRQMNYNLAYAHCKTKGFQMFTMDEYKKLQAITLERYEKQSLTWVESGEKPRHGYNAGWLERNGHGRVRQDASSPERSSARLGCRRTLRVKLDLKP